MSAAEIIAELPRLSPQEREQIQARLNELGRDPSAIRANQTYEVWSPDSAFAAADVMLRALASEERT